MKKIALLAGVAALLAVGCNQQDEKGDFKIDVKLANAPLDKVILEELTTEYPKIVDSSKVTEAQGTFSFKGLVNNQGLYRIRFSDGKFILLALDAGDIAIDGDYNALEKIAIKGSDGSAEIRDLLNKYNEKSITLSRLRMVLDSLQQSKGSDSLLNVEGVRFQKEIEQLKTDVTSVVEKTKNPATAVFALTLLPPQSEQEMLAYKGELEKLTKRFPQNAFVKSVLTSVEAELKPQQADQQQAPDGPEKMIGQTAPDFTLADPNGKMVSLSSFRGKYLLVDFWASWCGPCRQENPNVVKAYNAYKNKNFTILGVSLDKTKDQWMKAIAADGLNWSHVSDLKFWESAVVPLYNISGIPTNILVDPSGKIVAANLRGEALEAKLSELLK
ncbi:TlpA disulfide reductase family protein [uncultured Chitinophaga sp.]|uniref:TlpA disulfide reductase family protein n=1 Tax=uncultured Chitinophaga sp. TaxID=339340 RepID=UPI0025EAA713|nr:TlpA disulfide reductase family protein [uncultured Chitinophaga sp.]